MPSLPPLNVLTRTFVACLASVVTLCWWIAPSHSADETQSRPANATVRRIINQENSAVNLHESREVLSEYKGDDQLQEALRQNLARPLSLTSGDFDEDGMPDLVAAYAGPSSGILVLHRGNVDAIFPDSPQAQQRRNRGEDADLPFLSPAQVFAAPEAPDFVAAGDFDADGHLDIVTAMRGSNSLYLLSGDGRGSFQPSRTIRLPGAVSTLVSGEINRRDGLTDIVVGVSGARGAEVLIYASAKGALKDDPEVISLPAETRALALGRLRGSAYEDLAIAAGERLLIVEGRERQKEKAVDPSDSIANTAPVIQQLSFPNIISTMVVGDFSAGERERLALLQVDGSMQMVSWGPKGWKSEAVTSGTWSQANGLVRARVSTRGGDDIVVLNGATGSLEILTNEDKGLNKLAGATTLEETAPTLALAVDGLPVSPVDAQRASNSEQAISVGATQPNRGTIVRHAMTELSPMRLSQELVLSLEEAPAAVLPMRLTRDATNSLVVLKQGQSEPEVLEAASNLSPEAAFVVTNTFNSGAGSLRQAILDSNAAAPGPNTITFNIPDSGVHTISPVSALPTITVPVTIDGYTQPGASANTLPNADNAILRIEINGVNAGASVGLLITAGNSTIRGLVVNRFGDVGIESHTTSAVGNIIEGNFIGTDPTGTTALGNGATVVNAGGVFIANGANNNTIGGTTPAARNLISGNVNDGIQFFSGGGSNPNPFNNTVRGNFLGTTATGTAALGNARVGVFISGSPNNTIGGTISGARNIISRNGNVGAEIGGTAATANNVQGNYIGTDVTGTTALGNGATAANAGGVFIFGGASNNAIGGTTSTARNLISGNVNDGVQFSSGGGSNPNPFNNFVQGNFIGTNVTGTAALANLRIGIFNSGAPGNTMGGTISGARNLISGNSLDGVLIQSSTATNNLIQGNYIGTDVNGTAVLANARIGIFIFASPNNTIGGTTSSARNVISGNASFGIQIQETTATGNIVAGNFIGTNASGTAAVGNGAAGVFFVNSPNNTIGGTTTGARNIISGNLDNVLIEGSTATNNSIQGNYIGTDVNGTATLGGIGQGVLIRGAPNNIIGGTAAGAGNLISGNESNGIWVVVNGASGNQIQGNLIGTNATGTVALPNAARGVDLDPGATNTLVGGTTAAARNVISGNSLDGVLIQSSTATNNLVQGNFIGTDVSGTAALGNGQLGIFIFASPNNTIGGTMSSARNVISGNASVGIQIQETGAGGNIVAGNFIGTNQSGTAAVGNGASGVYIAGSPNTTIGGTTSGARNIISGNQHNVIIAGSAATNNLIQGNYIGTDVNGTASLGGSGQGVFISAAGNNVIGGFEVGQGNLISGNQSNGIWIVSSGASGNQIRGNLIGTNASGTAALPNAARGVDIDAGATNNVVGGVTDGSPRNIISGNNLDGVLIQGSTTTNNLVQGNYIGTDINGTAALDNGLDGVFVTGNNNTIGGLTAGARNIISGNGSSGIEIGTATANVVQGNYIGTDINGTAEIENGENGVLVSGTNNTIGGTTATARNVISGNGLSGVWFSGSSTTGNMVQGNYIGTNASGSAALANSFDGVTITDSANNNTVGGTTASARNIISGNNSWGVELNQTSGNVISGNFIGTDVSGMVALGNDSEGVALFYGSNNLVGGTTVGARNVISGNTGGVLLFSENGSFVQGNYIGTDVTGNGGLPNLSEGIVVAADNNTIGGTMAGEGNTIAFNSGTGVMVPNMGEVPLGKNNSIRGNSIFANGGLGINLGFDGVTLNDPCDADTGANFLQNFPVLTQAANVNSVTVITGTLNSTSSTTFNIDFYANTAADASGYGEGQTYIGSGTASTSQSCSVSFSFNFPQVPIGQFISATATDPAGNTSEFSLCVQVASPTAAPASISGRVTTSDGLPLAGATINLLGANVAQTITAANGNYKFDNLDTGAFYTVAAARVNYTFTPTNRSFSLLGNKLDAVFTAIPDAAVLANPLDTDLFFIREQYLDLLGREPDTGGLAYWSDQIHQCGSDAACTNSRRIGVAGAFFIEQEFQQTGSFVYRLYSAALGRQLSFAEFSQDRRQVVDGASLETNKLAFADAFVQRPEFVRKYFADTNAEGFVDAVIQTVQQSCGVDMTGQRRTLVARYNTGKSLIESRSLVLRDVVEDAGFKQTEYNRAFVLMEYFGYLRRDPDKGGYDFWLNVLNDREPENYRGMVCAFITSAEYQRRFSSVVSRSNAECSR